MHAHTDREGSWSCGLRYGAQQAPWSATTRVRFPEWRYIFIYRVNLCELCVWGGWIWKGGGSWLCSLLCCAERDDPGSTPRVAVHFYLQSQLVFWLFDGVPLTPMSSHCWHIKESYDSVRVQVMDSGRSTQERKQYVCAFGVACLSFNQVRHSPHSELALLVRVR